MNKTYYIAVDGRQTGPFVFEELKYHNLRPETLVWREGLENWVPASSLAELSPILYGTPDSSYPGQPAGYRQPAGYQQPSAYQQPAGYQQPVAHTNWMPWAIATTVLGLLFGCIALILGIIAISKANTANNFYRMGDEINGDRANNSAKNLVIAGLIFVGLGIIGTICLWSTGMFNSIYGL